MRACVYYGIAVDTGAMHTVVETPRFLTDAARLFTDVEREAIVDRVAADPRCGVIVPGGASER